MLEAREIAYRFGRRLFGPLDITIAPGQVVGLAGPSGVGKSTLGRLLSGHLALQAGTIRIDGRPIASQGFHPVQLLAQTSQLAVDPRWTIRRVLHQAHRPAPEMLAAFGIMESWLDRFPHEISGGQLQRVAVMRSLAPDTRYLVADEITAMLDPLTQVQIWQALLGWARAQRVGILAISHDHALLGRLCDRAFGLDPDAGLVPLALQSSSPG